MLVLLDPGVLFSGNWTHMLNTVSQVISLLILYEICSFNHFRQVMQVENEATTTTINLLWLVCQSALCVIYAY